MSSRAAGGPIRIIYVSPTEEAARGQDIPVVRLAWLVRECAQRAMQKTLLWAYARSRHSKALELDAACWVQLGQIAGMRQSRSRSSTNGNGHG